MTQLAAARSDGSEMWDSACQAQTRNNFRLPQISSLFSLPKQAVERQPIEDNPKDLRDMARAYLEVDREESASKRRKLSQGSPPLEQVEIKSSSDLQDLLAFSQDAGQDVKHSK